MQSITELKEHIENRIKECKLEKRSMEIWLAALTPANFILVAIALVFSLIAGASILTTSEIISVNTAGILALISAVFTTIHNRLRCEPHQAEIGRLRGAYRGLKTAYEALSIETDPNVLRAKIAELDPLLGHLPQTASASPERWSVERAKKEVFGAGP